MAVKNTLAALLLAAMAAAWWWVRSGPAFRPGMSQTAVRPTASAARAPADPPKVRWERLALRAVPERASGRNPFGGDRRAPRAAGIRTVLPEDEPATAGTPPAGPPRITLIGIGSRTTPDGIVRVAVFAGERDVLHAGAGDAVADTYRVERIGDTDVDLVRLADAARVTLRLPP